MLALDLFVYVIITIFILTLLEGVIDAAKRYIESKEKE